MRRRWEIWYAREGTGSHTLFMAGALKTIKKQQKDKRLSSTTGLTWAAWQPSRCKRRKSFCITGQKLVWSRILRSSFTKWKNVDYLWGSILSYLWVILTFRYKAGCDWLKQQYQTKESYSEPMLRFALQLFDETWPKSYFSCNLHKRRIESELIFAAPCVLLFFLNTFWRHVINDYGLFHLNRFIYIVKVMNTN